MFVTGSLPIGMHPCSVTAAADRTGDVTHSVRMDSTHMQRTGLGE